METVIYTNVREKPSSQAAHGVLAALRLIAESQGRQFLAMLGVALRDHIDRQQKNRPSRHLMASFASSLNEFDCLHRELIKSAVGNDERPVPDQQPLLGARGFGVGLLATGRSVRRPVTYLCSTLAMSVWCGMPHSSALI